MSMFPNSGVRRVELEYATQDRTVFNFFNAVYAWMAVGLAVTAVVGWAISHSQAGMMFIYGGKATYLLLSLGAFGIAMLVQTIGLRISVAAGLALFLTYAALIGALFSGIFIIYPAKVLIASLFLTGGTFAGMSIYGFVTKRDLTRIGSIAIMAVWGLILASLVNFFWANNTLDWIITYAVLAVFLVITAYKTQWLKEFAQSNGDNPALASRMAVIGSLVLYIAFINLFISILKIMGSRR